MNVWTNANFNGHYPVGSAAVVVCENAEEAARLLMAALAEVGLKQAVSADDMKLLDISFRHVDILVDGDY